MKLRAAISAAALSLLFVVVYSTTNYLASLQANVGTWYYAWEMQIPFVPLMILPYMSIDIFFVIAPFLCRDRQELAIFNKRVVVLILVSGTVFYLYPLRLAYAREPVAGWLGMIFNPFVQMDQPYNLLPSLHIGLRTILAHLYARKSTGWLHVLLQIWFSLIGLSTLLVHQHQIVDVIGGFACALYVMYAIRPHSQRLPVVPNPRIGVYYGFGAVLAAVLALATLREGVHSALVGYCVGDCRHGLFWSRTGDLPQGEWRASDQHQIRLGTGLGGTTGFALVLSAAVSALG